MGPHSHPSMDFSKQDLDSMVRGIARIRRNDIVGIEEAESAIEYFSHLST